MVLSPSLRSEKLADGETVVGTVPPNSRTHAEFGRPSAPVNEETKQVLLAGYVRASHSASDEHCVQSRWTSAIVGNSVGASDGLDVTGGRVETGRVGEAVSVMYGAMVENLEFETP